MKVRRGCGCPIIILGLTNLTFLVAGVVSLVRSTSPVLGSLFIVFMGLGNAVICGMVGLAAFRNQPLSASVNAGPEGGDAEEGEEDGGGGPP